MADADASAAFELEDDSLASGLDALASKFSALAGQINASFAAANAQLARTAATTAALGAGGALLTKLSRGLELAARSAQLVTTALGGIVGTLTRVAPLIRYIPESLGRWVAPAKAIAAGFTHVAAQVGVAMKSVQAFTGRLGVLSAAFFAVELRELGASKAAAAWGAAGALAMSKVIAGARGAIAGVAALSRAIATATGRLVTMSAAAAGGALAALGRSLATLTMVFAPLASLAFILGPLGAAAIAAAGSFHLLGRAIKAAGETQSLQTGFVTLLGSADKARARMAELSKFATETPFEIPQVARASKVLETLTRGALSTGAGLRMVGDVASVTGQPIEDLSVHVGRLYDGLMNGRPVGEALMRLQELGIVTAATRAQLENLQKSGAKGNAVWSVAGRDLGRFSGEMKRQSMTWQGIMSNFSDAVGNIFRAIGTPLITALSPAMLRLNEWLASLVPLAEKFGSVVAGWGATMAQGFASGRLGEALGLAVKIGFGEAANFLLSGLLAAGNALNTLLSGGGREVLTLLSAATTAEFWGGLGSALQAAGQSFISLLLEGVAQLLAKLRDVPGIGGRAAAASASAHDLAGDWAAGAAGSAERAAAPLSAIFGDSARRMQSVFEKALSAFEEGGRIGSHAFDTGESREALAKLFHELGVAARAEAARVGRAAEVGGLPAPVPQAVPDGSGARAEVGYLQKIGGGGGGSGFSFSGKDPVVAATNGVARQTEKNGTKLDAILLALTKPASPPRLGLAVFG